MQILLLPQTLLIEVLSLNQAAELRLDLFISERADTKQL